ncbi:MAG: tetratricopeptide repeat protein [Deltaproteobacteria bacterium]|nr:tetratricopeptide repeat protein [Deltaproteobacteria bacterium]
MLEKGIEQARAGLWDQAVVLFNQAVAASTADPGIKPKAAARAHWDLGLAYEYTGRFDEAYSEIRKAYELTNEPEYGQELMNVKKMKEEKEELKKQLENKQ